MSSMPREIALFLSIGLTRQTAGIVSGLVAKAVDIPINVLAGQLSKCVEDVRKVLASVAVTEGKTRLKSVEFSLGIDSDGKVSLLSTVSGSIATKTALKFTLDITEG